jgi:hypothetical protein
LSAAELRLTNLVTTDALADVLPQMGVSAVPMAALPAKPVQDRFAGNAADSETNPQPAKSTKTAEASVPTGGTAAPAPAAK